MPKILHDDGLKAFAKIISSQATHSNVPTSAQLSKINELSRVPLTADEVYVGSIDLANDQVDRSYEWFPVPVLRQFGKSIVARNLEMGHEYRINPPQGLFFDASVVKESDVNWLRCSYYMPKTADNEHTRAMIDAGVYRYASIGFGPADDVSFGDGADLICDICGNSFYDYENCPHWPGQKYPVRGEDVTATFHYEGKWQAVEGSIVYLGCQYGAEMKSRTEPTLERQAADVAMLERIAEGYAVERAVAFCKSFEGVTVPRRKMKPVDDTPAPEPPETMIDGTTTVMPELNVADLPDVPEPRSIIDGIIEKVGRVLSAANEAKLVSARDGIDAVLDSVQVQEEPPDPTLDTAPEPTPKDPEPPAVEVVAPPTVIESDLTKRLVEDYVAQFRIRLAAMLRGETSPD